MYVSKVFVPEGRHLETHSMRKNVINYPGFPDCFGWIPVIAVLQLQLTSMDMQPTLQSFSDVRIKGVCTREQL